MRVSRKYIFSRLLSIKNNFPSDLESFMESEWHHWIKRIEDGANNILEPIDREIQTLPPNEIDDAIDFYSNEAYAATNLSEFMYQGLIVGLWSRNEQLFKLTCQYIDPSRIEEINAYNFTFAKWISFIEGAYSTISIKNLHKYAEINGLRILSNVFKHKNGYYDSSKADLQNKLEQDFINKYGISVKRNIDGDYIGKIKYSEIRFYELILTLHEFWDALFAEIT